MLLEVLDLRFLLYSTFFHTGPDQGDFMLLIEGVWP